MSPAQGHTAGQGPERTWRPGHQIPSPRRYVPKPHVLSPRRRGPRARPLWDASSVASRASCPKFPFQPLSTEGISISAWSCLFSPLLCLQCLGQCLSHSRGSTATCRVSKWGTPSVVEGGGEKAGEHPGWRERRQRAEALDAFRWGPSSNPGCEGGLPGRGCLC